MKKAAVLLVLGLLVRLMAAWVADFFVDESHSYTLVRSASESIEGALRTENHPPLFYLAMRPLALATRSPFLLRLPNLLCSVAALWINFLLCRQLAGERVALVVLLLCSIVHGFWNMDSLMRMYGMTALFLSGQLLYVLKSSEEPDWRADPKLTAGFWCCSLALPLTHYFGALLQGISFLWCLLYLRRSLLDRKLTLPLLLGLLACVGWVVFAITNPGRSQLTIHHDFVAHQLIIPWDLCSYFTGLPTISGWPVLRAGYRGILHTMGVESVFGIGCWVLAFVGFRRLWLKRRTGALYLGILLFVLLGALVTVAFFQGAYIFQNRYFLPLAPYLIFFFALGVEATGALANLILGFLVAINLCVVGAYPGDSFWWNQNWRDVAKFVETRAQPGDVLYAHDWYGLVGLGFYLWDGRCAPRLMELGSYATGVPPDLPLAAEMPMSAGNLGPDLEAQIRGKRLFLLLSQPRGPEVRNWFLQRCNVLDILQLGSISSWGNTEVFLLEGRAPQQP